METRHRWVVALLALAFGPGLAAAQGVRGGPTVSTGYIIESSPEEAGALLIYSMERRRPIIFRALQGARVETASGLPAPWSALVPELSVTVQHAFRNGCWRVEKVMIPDAQALPVYRPRMLTGAESHALRSKAYNDGDITTNPGVRARIDNDITTQPGTKDPDDPDITRWSND